ncbi:MAG: transposase [Thermodesulfobacteriaceae bacterium]|nr:transposase [Thermodesulfobacteriaceae bacterium]
MLGLGEGKEVPAPSTIGRFRKSLAEREQGKIGRAYSK